MNFNFSEKELFDGGIFIMLVGPPGSGKSKFAKAIKRNYMNFEIVSPEDIRRNLFGDKYDQSVNHVVFDQVHDDIRKHFNNDCNVLYDGTNCRTSYRRKMIDFLKENNLAKIIFCVVFTTPVSKCLENNRKLLKNLQVPESAIENMYIGLKQHPPTIFEGYDAIFNSKGLC